MAESDWVEGGWATARSGLEGSRRRKVVGREDSGLTEGLLVPSRARCRVDGSAGKGSAGGGACDPGHAVVVDENLAVLELARHRVVRHHRLAEILVDTVVPPHCGAGVSVAAGKYVRLHPSCEIVSGDRIEMAAARGARNRIRIALQEGQRLLTVVARRHQSVVKGH
eukprot:CAMPEP_0174723458 /NCGR_PEP_ID=MMETSP1094-20130205/40977_1 /TAXON_ID=156173 /ORGANISM="Chrysochromulina brevifilum, Strain UTEX LB 985" /LENGTH=166 /DNA_ID=CAMNT_0015924503 /DNA_START=288 /DNA_END=787 /DNA_ORIENTATION=-